jgi:hypothetical protein
MNILALKVVVTDQELTELTRRELRSSKAPLKDVTIRFTPEGVQVKGSYHMMVTMPFETEWKVTVEAGRLVLTLGDLKVSGFGAAMMRGVMLQTIAANVPIRDAVTVKDESLVVDLDRVLSQNGLNARTNLRSVRCDAGTMVIEAGTPEA